MIKVIKARLCGVPLPKFKYRDLGSLVSLADYHTVRRHLERPQARRNVCPARLSFPCIRCTSRALHGNFKTALDTIVRFITRRTEPRIKLH